jgi:hypothetical protein
LRLPARATARDGRYPAYGDVPPLPLAALPELPARADDVLACQVNELSFDQFVQTTLRDCRVPGAMVAVTGAEGAAGAVDENTRFRSPR